MGTDIEMYAEKREAGSWKPCFPLRRGNLGDPRMTVEYRNDRNYALFRILADVGRLTNQGIVPVFKPRGLPDDLSPELATLADFIADYDFSHNYSWLLLRELLEFPWYEQRHRGRTLAGQCDVFVRRTIPLLQRYGGPDDVRIVFWFAS
jgi:hypothetical protein